MVIEALLHRRDTHPSIDENKPQNLLLFGCLTLQIKPSFQWLTTQLLCCVDCKMKMEKAIKAVK